MRTHTWADVFADLAVEQEREDREAAEALNTNQNLLDMADWLSQRFGGE